MSSPRCLVILLALCAPYRYRHHARRSSDRAGDAVLLAALGPLLARCYLAVRRSEAAAFASEDLGFEIRHHFYRF